jgi:hypothetical protein
MGANLSGSPGGFGGGPDVSLFYLVVTLRLPL